MKVAILSDIHGNLEGLSAVMADAEARGCREVHCCGDIVGYGADPNACCERLREYWDARGTSPHPAVLGNHDEAIAVLSHTPGFNRYATAAADWTRDALSPENRAWLAALPRRMELGPLLLTHGTARNPEAWNYLVGEWETSQDLEWFAWAFADKRLYCVGHSHHPFVQGTDGRSEPYELCRLEEGRHYAVNVGSAGQPRDGDPRACYAVWDREAMTVQLHRVEYDIETAQRKIREAGLPPVLAERLAQGR